MPNPDKVLTFCVQLPVPPGMTTDELHVALSKLRALLRRNLGPFAQVIDEIGADFTTERAELFVVPKSRVHLQDTRRICLTVLHDMGIETPADYLKTSVPLPERHVIPVTQEDVDAEKLIRGKAFFNTIKMVLLTTAQEHRHKPWEWVDAAEGKLAKLRVARSFILELRYFGMKEPRAVGEDGMYSVLDLVRENPVWFPSFDPKNRQSAPQPPRSLPDR